MSLALLAPVTPRRSSLGTPLFLHRVQPRAPFHKSPQEANGSGGQPWDPVLLHCKRPALSPQTSTPSRRLSPRSLHFLESQTWTLSSQKANPSSRSLNFTGSQSWPPVLLASQEASLGPLSLSPPRSLPLAPSETYFYFLDEILLYPPIIGSIILRYLNCPVPHTDEIRSGTNTVYSEMIRGC